MSDAPTVTYLSVKNWDRYQHYSDRSPIWIKLHTSTLHDRKVRALPPLAQLLWYDMLQLAAYYGNAVMNAPEAIARETGIPPAQVRDDLKTLLGAGLLRETKTPRRASVHALRERRKTGWRRTKSVAAEHYVRDPEGTDRPPPWWKQAA